MFNNKELEILYKKLWNDYKNLTEDEKDLMYKIENEIRNSTDDEEEEDENNFRR